MWSFEWKTGENLKLGEIAKFSKFAIGRPPSFTLGKNRGFSYLMLRRLSAIIVLKDS